MSMKDYFDDYDPYDEDPYSVSCKHCGEDELYWEETDKGWRLFDFSGSPHVCDVSDDFEELV